MNQPSQPLSPPMFQQPIAVQPQGLGEMSTGGAALLGLAVAAGGAYGGYLIGAKVGSPKHQTAGKIIGAIAGWIIVPAVVGGVLAAVSAPRTGA
jgi:glycine zipper 2TM protein